MAEPTIDSANFNPEAGIKPPAGPGSKTDPDPLLGVQNPIGAGPKTMPAGLPGAPAGPGGPPGAVPTPTPQEVQNEQKLLLRSIPAVVDDIQDIISKKKEKEEEIIVGDVLHELDGIGWPVGRLKEIVNYSGQKAKEFFEEVIKTIQLDGVPKAIADIRNKLQDGFLETNSTLAPPQAAPVEGLPLPQSSKKSQTDVYPNNDLKRGILMSKKFRINNGTLEEASAQSSDVLMRLTQAMRKVRSSVKEYEEVKIRTAGKLALRKMAEEEEKEENEENDSKGMDLGMEAPVDEAADEALVDIEDAQKKLDEAVKTLGGEISGAEDSLISEDMPGDLALDIEGGVESAKNLLASAKDVIKQAKTAEFPFMKKKDDKKEKKDDKKDEKKEKKEEKKEKKEDGEKTASEEDVTLSDLLKKVRARIEVLKREKEATVEENEDMSKEAQLYPFKNLAGGAEKVTDPGFKMVGPEGSKDSKESISPASADKTLPVKNEGKNISGKDVKMKGASLEVENAFSKARLAVELASQQQLKGLIENPLKTALVKEMTEIGISKKAAEVIVHNAFVEAYEPAQKIVMKEAFETFIDKDINEFIKIAKFTKDYAVKEAFLEGAAAGLADAAGSAAGAIDSGVSAISGATGLSPDAVVGGAAGGAAGLGAGLMLAGGDDEKEASESVPLRPSKTASDRTSEFKTYWTAVKQDRRGF